MREISTEKIKVGEHILVDGEEYLAEEANGRVCDSCALGKSHKCYSIPCDCDNVIFKRIEKEPQYRPYKDTEEMIADFKERFSVSNIPPFGMPLIWVKYMEVCSLITDIKPEMVVVNGDVQSMTDLSVWYTYLDGSPCGKVEE